MKDVHLGEESSLAPSFYKPLALLECLQSGTDAVRQDDLRKEVKAELREAGGAGEGEERATDPSKETHHSEGFHWTCAYMSTQCQL